MSAPSTTEAFVEFGRELRAQREQRGLPLEGVARTTKIPPTILVALEEGQATRFPERVFMLNYLRSYAQAVGLPPEDVVRRFDALPAAEKSESFDPAALELARREQALTVAWVLLAAVLLVVALFTFDSLGTLAERSTHR